MSEDQKLTKEQVTEMVKTTMGQCSDALSRIELERSAINQWLKDLSKETGIPVKTLRKNAITYHKGDFDEKNQEYLDFKTLYLSTFRN